MNFGSVWKKEESFAETASRLARVLSRSEGPFGPIPLANVPKELANILRSLKVGEINPPPLFNR